MLALTCIDIFDVKFLWVCVRTSREPFSCVNEWGVVPEILDTCLRAPIVVSLKMMRSRLQLKGQTAPGHVDRYSHFV